MYECAKNREGKRKSKLVKSIFCIQTKRGSWKPRPPKPILAFFCKNQSSKTKKFFKPFSSLKRSSQETSRLDKFLGLKCTQGEKTHFFHSHSHKKKRQKNAINPGNTISNLLEGVRF